MSALGLWSENTDIDVNDFDVSKIRGGPNGDVSQFSFGTAA